MVRLICRLAGVFLLFLGCYGVGAQSNNDRETATEANIAYQQGDYDAAIALYMQLLDSGNDNFSLHFNLGSAYYLSGEPGWALYHLRLAQMHNPRSREVYARLALVRSERVDFLPTSEATFIDVVGTTTNALMTMAELHIVVFILWNGWFLLAVGWVWQFRWRKRLNLLLVVWGIVLGIGIGLLVSRIYVETQRPSAVLLTLASESMSGPGETYPTIDRLYAGAEMRILDRRAGWIRYLLPDGRQGWLPQTVIADF